MNLRIALLILFTLPCIAQAQMDFKGLRPGITTQELDSFVTANAWHYSNAVDNDDKRYYDNPTRIAPYFGAVWIVPSDNSLGCIMVKGRAQCYNHDPIQALLYDGKVCSISIMSGFLRHAAEGMRNWMKIALAGITEKIGKPTKTFTNINKVSLRPVFTGRDRHSLNIAQWIIPKENQRIDFDVFTGEHYVLPFNGKIKEATVMITITDTKIEAMENEAEHPTKNLKSTNDSKIKSGF